MVGVVGHTTCKHIQSFTPTETHTHTHTCAPKRGMHAQHTLAKMHTDTWTHSHMHAHAHKRAHKHTHTFHMHTHRACTHTHYKYKRTISIHKRPEPQTTYAHIHVYAHNAHNAHTHARTHTVLVQHTHTCNTDQMRRLVRKPELGSTVHVVYWEVVDKAGILKHLHRRTSQQISLQHTFIFFVTPAPATAKNSPSLSKSIIQQLLGSP